MATEPVHLHFTQDDRDRLMRIDQSVTALLERHDEQERRLNRHNSRLKKLEAVREQAKGAAAAMRLLWAALGALAGLFGWHIAQH